MFQFNIFFVFSHSRGDTVLISLFSNFLLSILLLPFCLWCREWRLCGHQTDQSPRYSKRCA
jgi:hypothetical protein